MSDTAKRPLTVEEAHARVLDGVVPVTDTVSVDLFAAAGRVLATAVCARHTQPPFDASAMDGYAVRAADVAALPVTLAVVGAAAAGHRYDGRLEAGEAIRIFTGAPMPHGADAVVIQENTTRAGDRVTVADGTVDIEHVRPRGGDFAQGATLLEAGTRLAARHLTLAAAGGHARVLVRRRPVVAILATGDELVMPGEVPASDQIVCSNPFGVAAIIAAAGGEPRFVGIARDTVADLDQKIAAAADADIVVTLGGASVGDHDLVGPVLAKRGLDLAFWKIAMRPGKPLMFGRLGRQRVLGLPGNPVSALITARLFVAPLVQALLGLSTAAEGPQSAVLASPLPKNGPRAHYMRAILGPPHDGKRTVRPLPNQDSSLLTPLSAADCLIVRPIAAASAPVGTEVPVLLLDF